MFVTTPRNLLYILAVSTALISVVFAAYTEHVWEDYYITFRSSKNLVEGNGLVFNVGERVHTFTSPLGVLTPALAAFITGGESDFVSLWVFRIMSIMALVGAVLLLTNLAQAWRIPTGLVLLAGAWLALDGKTVDFSINGMESAFLVLFLSYALWGHMRGSTAWKHQGVAWAGLMWTRPDCFIHISVMALAVLLFGNGRLSESRRDLILSWLKAGGLTTVLYLPWFLWAWSYYGTPVPHTVAAKSGLTDPFSIVAFLKEFGLLPFSAAGVENSVRYTFLPAYHDMGGWNSGVVMIGKVLAGLIAMAWILPKVSRRTRMLSFTFAGIHLYLSYFPYYCFPWYVPGTIPFAILGGISLLADIGGSTDSFRTLRQKISLSIAGAIVLGSGWLTLEIAQQVRTQQQLVENEVRQAIGDYLCENAQTDDTVMMEPLGYIGYFSGLRTYDFPGMSSPEMVAARKLVGRDGRRLLGFLRPDWTVMRPHEIDHLQHNNEWRVEHAYELVKTFSTVEQVEASNVQGKEYLLHDATFKLFKRRDAKVSAENNWSAVSDFGVYEIDVGVERLISTHAECEVKFTIPAGSRSVALTFGFHDGTDKGNSPTDGVAFGLDIRDVPTVIPIDFFEMNPARDGFRISKTYALPEGLSAEAVLRVVVDRIIWKDSDGALLSSPVFSAEPLPVE
jgi:hypothetical protein